MWGPYNRSGRKLKDATRPSRFYGRRGPATDIGPVTLHAQGRRSRSETGFDVAVAGYVATLFVATITGILAFTASGWFVTLFLGATSITALFGAVHIWFTGRKGWGSFGLSLPLLLVGLPLALGFLGMVLPL
jgi:hypothetical protein